MSRSPFFYLEVYDIQDDKWIYVDPLVWNYKRTERVPADLWPYNGTHDLFQELGVEGSYSSTDFAAIRHGLPADSCEEIKNNFNNDDFHPKWFTYADAQVYYLKHPKVTDWYAEPDEETGEIPKQENPIKPLLDRVDAFLEVWDDFDRYREYPSGIRIVFDVL